jgi:acetyltransferase-like isoleucine patch superfamily enzyme
MSMLRYGSQYLFDRYNTFKYKRKFVSLENLHLVGRAGLVVVGSGQFSAKNLSIFAPYYPVGLFAGLGAKMRFNGDVFLNQGVGISCASGITIETETIVSDMAKITDTDWHGIDGNPTRTEPIHIGKHVWIGFRSIILKGVTIGDYSIIGAGSLITHPVPPNTIVAGNPAKKIGETKTGYTK